MDDTAQKMPRVASLVYWVARIWSVLIIAFTLVILVGHLFFPEEGGATSVPWYDYLMPLSMLVSVAGLALTWRWQTLGSAICIGFALLNMAIYIIVGGTQPWNVLGLVVLPVILPAFLFLLYAWLSSAPRN